MLGLGNSIAHSSYVSGATPKLLDTSGGAAVAYSLRLLNSSYGGNAVTVRRSNDNAEANIGFAGGELDTKALSDHCGSNDGFVADWLDQSGNGNDASQATAGSQPKIYDGSSAAVVTENGKPAVEFDGTNDGYILDTSGLDIGSLSSFTVGKFATTANQNMMLALSGNVSNKRWYAPYSTNGNINFGYATSGVAISTTLNTNQNVFTMIAGTTLSGVEAWVNSSSIGTATLTTGIDTTKTGLGNWNGSLYTDGTIQEVIYYSADKSTDRTDIEDNINTFYSIY